MKSKHLTCPLCNSTVYYYVYPLIKTACDKCGLQVVWTEETQLDTVDRLLHTMQLFEQLTRKLNNETDNSL